MSAHRECRDGDPKCRPREAAHEIRERAPSKGGTRAGNNRLIVHAFYRSGEGDEDGQRPRLECRAEPGGAYCRCESPVPAGVEIEWV
jgi:hypothetical protein